MAKQQLACITLDLEPDHAGVVPTETYKCWNEPVRQVLLSTLRTFRAPLSVFVVGQSLQKQPVFVGKLQESGAEFHLHSYSHNCSDPDSRYEISAGKKAFQAFFKHKPAGYRTPMGKIAQSDYQLLLNEKFEFSSSVHSSIWPHPKYLQFPNIPYREPSTNLLEIPVTTNPLIKLPLSLGWIKLIGWAPYEYFLQHTTLSPIIFNLHLHDLYQSPTHEQLPWHWKLAYQRNKESGFDYLYRSLYTLASRGYQFIKLSELTSHYKSL
jgi:peptidoglycan/xylan/chitin deacetylase (PgdA/CDA1 family)